MRILGREPAYWLALTSALIALVSSAVFPLSTDQQGILNGAVAAALGVVTAFVLKGERLVAALVGFFKAALAVALAFKLNLDPEVQATAMIVIELVLTGVLVRPNVFPPVPAPAALVNGAYDITSLRTKES